MEILQSVHSYLAYVALGLLIFAVLNAVSGWMGNKVFTMGRDLRLSLFTLIICHIQLVLGLLLFAFSSNGLAALNEFGVGGLNAPARLLALEHPLINIIAIALITIGWSRHKKFLDGKPKFKSIAIFYGLGLVLILSRIPWGQWFG